MMLIASSKRRVMSTWMFIIACGPNAERRLVLALVRRAVIAAVQGQHRQRMREEHRRRPPVT